jgi:hypothetical protein
MPIGPQPKGARGTIGHPYSALNLRLLLAAASMVSSAVFAWLSLWWGYPVLALVLAVLGVGAAADLVVIELRRRARRRAGEDHPSLFE